MGRSKYELKRVHRKKTRKTKEKIRLYSKGEITYDKLPQAAKLLLKKGKQKKVSLS